MNCPACHTEMDREDHYDFQRRDYDMLGPLIEHPSAEYNCPSCGYTAIWRRGQPLEVLHDPRE